MNPAAKSPVAAGDYAETLALDSIRESSTNPRRVFHGIEELAASIKQHGLLQAVVVRPAPGADGFEIVCGARRYRAAKLAGLTVVPASIKPMTDEQVLELQLIENLQREDVHPLEEADGYAALLDREGYNADLLAERVGKDRSYIYKRLQLARLAKPIKEAFLAGKITIALALLICRLPNEADQQRAYAKCFPWDWRASKRKPDFSKPASLPAYELDKWIRENITLELSAAPWKKDDAELLPSAGACNLCEKRSGASPTLFDDFSKKNDYCLDPGCFNEKCQAFVQVSIAKTAATGETLVPVSTHYGNPPKGMLSTSEYHKIRDKKDRCEFAEAAIVAHSDDDSYGEHIGHIGQRIQICRAGKKCSKHGGYGHQPKKDPGFAEQWKAKRERLDASIKLESYRELVRAIADQTKQLGPEHLAVIANRLVTGYLRHDGQKELAAILGIDVKKIEDSIPANKGIAGFLLAVCAIPGYGTSTYSDNWLAYAHSIAKLYNIDAAAIEKGIAAPLLKKFAEAKKKAEGAHKAKPKAKSAATS